ncbi:MAG: hypothetical protein ISR83_09085 [Candidatus Marinimicrobia bacterium]|nr:hypothetical protein [Candidatus Neomarinimicrobiota bacterium]
MKKSAIVFLSLILFFSCEDNRQAIHIIFGDDYSLSSGWCGTPPVLPAASINGNTLYIGLFYEGDCTDHTFTLNEADGDDGLYIWLFHNAHGDTCQNPAWSGYSQLLSQSMIDAEHIFVLDPNDSGMIQIK